MKFARLASDSPGGAEALEVCAAGHVLRPLLWQGSRTSVAVQLRDRAVPIELISYDKDSGAKVSFVSAYNSFSRIFYAKLQASNVFQGVEDPEASINERSLKGAITSLLDVAEACGARKIHLGIGSEYASGAELICSFLYLGFQVIPARKFPLNGIALLLEFQISYHHRGSGGNSDQTCTGTSQASTSAEDDAAENVEETATESVDDE